MDRYIRQQAGQDIKRRVSAVYVQSDDDKPSIIGYYTLSATSVKLEDCPPEILKQFPKHPLPATLIGRLAVDRRFQGQGRGGLLLLDALRRSWWSSAQVGSCAVVVHVKDEAAARFYAQYGFIPLLSHPRHLFLPMATVAKLFMPGA